MRFVCYVTLRSMAYAFIHPIWPPFRPHHEYWTATADSQMDGHTEWQRHTHTHTYHHRQNDQRLWKLYAKTELLPVCETTRPRPDHLMLCAFTHTHTHKNPYNENRRENANKRNETKRTKKKELQQIKWNSWNEIKWRIGIIAVVCAHGNTSKLTRTETSIRVITHTHTRIRHLKSTCTTSESTVLTVRKLLLYIWCDSWTSREQAMRAGGRERERRGWWEWVHNCLCLREEWKK